MTSILGPTQANASDVNATVVAALIAAGVSVLTLLVSWFSNRGTRKAVEAHRTQDYRLRQLNELYGPLYMLRTTSRRLWRQLPDVADPEPGVTEWNLIDHFEEIRNDPDPRRRLVAEEILKINSELTELIVGKAGLLEQIPPPESFEKFLEHARTLQVHWDQGVNAIGVAHRPFPGEIDADIREALQRLRGGL